MTSPPSPAPQSAAAPRWLLIVGAFASALLFAAFLVGAMAMFRPASIAGPNWLIVLFDLNFRPNSTSASALSALSLVDIALMLLFGFLMAAMYPPLAKGNRAWAIIAVALPLLGIPIFIATSTAGRSAVLLAGLISSILAFRTRFGHPIVAIAGIVASALLLFVGDFGTAVFPPSTLLALLIGVGYSLWTAWLLFLTLEFVRHARPAAA